jgi:hypothetical protein
MKVGLKVVSGNYRYFEGEIMTGKWRAYGGITMGRMSGFREWRWGAITIVAVSILAATFARVTADGTVVVVGSLRTQSVAVGSWIRTGDRQFGLTHHRFNYGADGNLTGTIKIRASIALNDMLDCFTGVYRSDVFDLNGNLLRSGRGTLEGKRINVEPLE